MDIGKGTELTGLDIDRVDVVDKPATKRAFLLMKTEDGDKKDDVKKAQVPHQEPDAPKPPIYESMAKSVLDVFADASGLTKAQAESLEALAKGMGSGHKYKASEKAAPYTEEDGKKKPGDAQSDIPGMMKAVKEQGTQVESLAKSVEALGGMVEKLGGMVEKSLVTKAEGEKKDPPKSTQGKDDEKKPVVKKVGEGLFTSAIFPDAK